MQRGQGSSLTVGQSQRWSEAICPLVSSAQRRRCYLLPVSPFGPLTNQRTGKTVGLTLAALRLSGQQQQAAGSGTCVFLFHVSVCQNQRNGEMFTHEYEVHRSNGLVALTASASTHCPCSKIQSPHRTQPSF